MGEKEIDCDVEGPTVILRHYHSGRSANYTRIDGSFPSILGRRAHISRKTFEAMDVSAVGGEKKALHVSVPLGARACV